MWHMWRKCHVAWGIIEAGRAMGDARSAMRPQELLPDTTSYCMLILTTYTACLNRRLVLYNVICYILRLHVHTVGFHCARVDGRCMGQSMSAALKIEKGFDRVLVSASFACARRAGVHQPNSCPHDDRPRGGGGQHQQPGEEGENHRWLDCPAR